MNRLEASNGNAFSLPMLFFYNLTCLERPSKPSKVTIYMHSSQFEWLQLRFLGSFRLIPVSSAVQDFSAFIYYKSIYVHSGQNPAPHDP